MSLKPNEKHWEIMLNYFETHRDMVTERIVGPNGRTLLRKQWEELSTLLNSLGYGCKTSEKWQKTWSDNKYNLKKKASDIKRNQTQTGGGTFDQFFKEHELRVLNLMGPTFYEGLGTDEVGFNNQVNRLQSSSLSTMTLPKLTVPLPILPPIPLSEPLIVQSPATVPPTTVNLSQPVCPATATSNSTDHNYHKAPQKMPM